MTMLNFLKGKLLHVPEATLKIKVEIQVRARQFVCEPGDSPEANERSKRISLMSAKD